MWVWVRTGERMDMPALPFWKPSILGALLAVFGANKSVGRSMSPEAAPFKKIILIWGFRFNSHCYQAGRQLVSPEAASRTSEARLQVGASASLLPSFKSQQILAISWHGKLVMSAVFGKFSGKAAVEILSTDCIFNSFCFWNIQDSAIQNITPGTLHSFELWWLCPSRALRWLTEDTERERESHRKSSQLTGTKLRKTPRRIKHQAKKATVRRSRAHWYPSLSNNLAASTVAFDFQQFAEPLLSILAGCRAWRALPHLSETKWIKILHISSLSSSGKEFWSWSGYAAWILLSFKAVFPCFSSLFLSVPMRSPSSTWTLVPLIPSPNGIAAFFWISPPLFVSLSISTYRIYDAVCDWEFNMIDCLVVSCILCIHSTPTHTDIYFIFHRLTNPMYVCM